MTSETESLSGLVERVTYHNTDTGYCVLRIKAERQKDLITVVGHAMLFPQESLSSSQANGSMTRTMAYNLKLLS